MPDFVLSAGRTVAMPDVWALQIAGCCLMCMLIHAVGFRLHVVQCIAILGVAVGTIHPRPFCIWIYCRDVSLGHCLTGSHANTVLVLSGLLASLGIPSLVGMTWGVF